MWYKGAHLTAELVAGKGENPQTFRVCKLFVHSLQLLVVLVSETSFRCHIDNQTDMASTHRHPYRQTYRQTSQTRDMLNASNWYSKVAAS